METIDISKSKKIGEGKTAVIYAYGAGQVVKLFHSWVDEALIRNELNAAEYAYAQGVQTAKVFGLQRIGDQSAIIYERLNNDNMEHRLATRFWQSARLGRQMAALHLRVHKLKTDGARPGLKTSAAGQISNKAELSDAQKQKLLALLETLPDGDCLCHGDFHPQNILFHKREPRIIDWTASTAGHPMADVCGTYLIVKTAPLHREMSEARRRATERVVDKFLSAYLGEYFENTGFKQADMDAWLPVKAAMYIGFGLPEACEKVFKDIIDAVYTKLR